MEDFIQFIKVRKTFSTITTYLDLVTSRDSYWLILSRKHVTTIL